MASMWLWCPNRQSCFTEQDICSLRVHTRVTFSAAIIMCGAKATKRAIWKK
ncbi:Hypothetical predicted protein [Podarcis lilfordi]|uniref:Uncharacterized protein n=1 Tax=Podarcis lilfordi TaxID=74358 RepID=A0AA35JT84_9SAUR|nr:Hypothetical predicted protein [Podarcis lilfordi]